MTPYEKTRHDGKTVDALTHMALLEVEQRLGYPLTVFQGSYSTSVSTSAGTHDGGGVVDLAPWDQQRKVLRLREIGFAAWFRPELRGVWPAHIHAVLMGNLKLSTPARHQVAEYLAGRNGLANRGPDTGPRQFVARRFTWREGATRIAAARALIRQAHAQLASGVRGYAGVQRARTALGRADTLLPKI